MLDPAKLSKHVKSITELKKQVYTQYDEFEEKLEHMFVQLSSCSMKNPRALPSARSIMRTKRKEMIETSNSHDISVSKLIAAHAEWRTALREAIKLGIKIDNVQDEEKNYMKNWFFTPPDSFEITEELRKHPFGVLYTGTHHSSPVSIQKICCEYFHPDSLIELSVRIWELTDPRLHSNSLSSIQAVCCIEEEYEDIYVITQYHHKNLKQVINEDSNGDTSIGRSGFDLHMKTKILREIAGALMWLHNLDILHLDINLRSVSMYEGIAQLSGYGLREHLRYIEKDPRTIEFYENGDFYPVSYFAPEMWDDEFNVSKKTDVFAFGVLMWEVITEKDPATHWGSSIQEIETKIKSGQGLNLDKNTASRYLAEMSRSEYKSLSTIMRNCWNVDPDDRPDFQDIYHVLFDTNCPKSVRFCVGTAEVVEFDTFKDNFQKWLEKKNYGDHMTEEEKEVLTDQIDVIENNLKFLLKPRKGEVSLKNVLIFCNWYGLDESGPSDVIETIKEQFSRSCFFGFMNQKELLFTLSEKRKYIIRCSNTQAGAYTVSFTNKKRNLQQYRAASLEEADGYIKKESRAQPVERRRYYNDVSRSEDEIVEEEEEEKRSHPVFRTNMGYPM
eukprot:TRINITY_DN7433_c0_g1_i1.p1 TRINITY_DN7433_c0_g1~~TRINITY_DN7433_c0_g1_i1.p1  ORF type:complete len:614 (-),score=131.53 TRINITY_DN7433_c0_g1_i1:44-1885(-)